MKEVQNQNWPETVPVVTFDVRLGRLSRQLDFDYGAYDEYLRDRDLRDQDIETHEVHFKYANVHPLLNGGRYQREHNKVTVKLGKWVSADKANKWLVHETEHRIADCRSERAPTWMTVTSNASIDLGLPIALAGDIGTTVSNMSHNRELNRLSDLALLIGFSLLAAGSSVYFGLNPEERRARRAARVNKPNWVNIEDNYGIITADD